MEGRMEGGKDESKKVKKRKKEEGLKRAMVSDDRKEINETELMLQNVLGRQKQLFKGTKERYLEIRQNPK